MVEHIGDSGYVELADRAFAAVDAIVADLAAYLDKVHADDREFTASGRKDDLDGIRQQPFRRHVAQPAHVLHDRDLASVERLELDQFRCNKRLRIDTGRRQVAYAQPSKPTAATTERAANSRIGSALPLRTCSPASV